MAGSSSPFADAAAFYDAGRAPYAPAALDHLLSALRLPSDSRVLDLGCGPGVLAIPLSRAAGEVVAVDIDANMLAEGRRLAAAEGRTNIRWLQGRAEDLAPDLGTFDAVTLGQSLHWMDRDRVLDSLGAVIADGGALAIVDEDWRGRPESWTPVAVALITAYLGWAPRHPLKHPEVDHAPSLGRSRHFHAFTAQTFTHEISRDVASILACVYSSVRSSPAMFGDRREAFEAELTQALLRLNPSRVFVETIGTMVFVAPKASPA
jgi:ubiquinone/menaquinone biosynthesis C-methylase UbiE